MCGFGRGREAVEPALLALPRELDDQDRVLGGEPDQHDEADLGEDVDVHAAQQQPADRGEQAHRHDQDHGQRQEPAFVLRRKQQEHEHHGGDEHEQAAAGQLLLEGQLGPLVAEAVGQHLRRQILHRRKRGTGGGAGLGAALDLGRRIEIVARHPIGPADVAEGRDRAERHHRALIAARLQPADLAQLLAERRIGLGRDPEGAAEQVEVVDVDRPI